MTQTQKPLEPIPALLPRTDDGHQFVFYADSCSGVPGAPHEATLAAVNAVVSRLEPQPEFICFPGDEIRGLTSDDEALRQQWRYWLEHEMAWLDRQKIPLYHTTGNHTTYDADSEAIFREMLAHLPGNGPADQRGLAYFVRRHDLLLVFIHTLWSGMGGEGRVEVAWLDKTLSDHADARHKLVFGHHPVFPVNGFSGPFQRDVGPEHGRALWQVLVRHRVLAYVCSHILAFDVQVHQGVLQILTAGAGTAHRMPEGIEYLHCVQAALDDDGLRTQVLDVDGRVREWLQWPLQMLAASGWHPLQPGENDAPIQDRPAASGLKAEILRIRFTGVCPPPGNGRPQTLLTGWEPGAALAPLWIGLSGEEQRFQVLLGPAPGRSPHLWLGPDLDAGQPFTLELALHTGMGPGGLLWRRSQEMPWSSLSAASPWGPERLAWPSRWSVGHGQRGAEDRPFRGSDLRVLWHHQPLEFVL